MPFASIREKARESWREMSQFRNYELDKLIRVIDNLHEDIDDEHNRVRAYSFRLPKAFNPKLARKLDDYDRAVSAFSRLRAVQTDPAIEKIRKLYCKLPHGVFRTNEKFFENIIRAKTIETDNYKLLKVEGAKIMKAIKSELTRLKRRGG